MKHLLAIVLTALALLVALWVWKGQDDPARAELTFSGQAAEASPTLVQEPADVDEPAATPAEPLRTVAVAPPESTTRAVPTAPLLRVHVLAREDRRPIVGARMMLALEGHSPSCTHLESSRGRMGECPKTDPDGRAEFDVDAGVAYEVQVMGAASYGRVEFPVRALAAAEQREVEILVPTRDDVVLFGVLVDAETAAPIRDGKLVVEGEPIWRRVREASGADRSIVEVPVIGQPVLSDEQGRFELRGRSWNRQFASATAPGYARTVFPLVTGSSDPRQPLVVRMSRAAAVEFTIVDAAERPISGATVELTCSSDSIRQASAVYEYYGSAEPRWTGTSDVLGQAVIEELPPRVPLRLTLRCNGFADRAESEFVTLGIGERRRGRFTWGAGATIRGKVTDERQQPRARLKLWRRASEHASRKAVIFEKYEKPDATTITDEAGRFDFADVPPGRWLVGIAPVGNSGKVPALAKVVEVKESGEIVELALEVQAGLMIRGRISTPDGTPPPQCLLSVQQEELAVVLEEDSRDDGTFAIGPLPAGTWTLYADPIGGPFAASDPKRARAGETQVVLSLRSGGVVSGTIVNPSGSSVDAAVKLIRDDGGWSWGTVAQNGSFRFDSVPAGQYVLWANDRTHAIGSSPVLHVEAGQTAGPVEIRLSPGAQLEVRYVGSDALAHVSVHVGGLSIDEDGLPKEKVGLLAVPAGEVEVRWREQNTGVKSSQRVTLAVGEVKELTWDGKP